MFRYRIFRTALGYCGIVTSEKGLVATLLPVASQAAAERWLRKTCPQSREDRALLPKLVKSIRDYCDGKPARFTEKLDLDGLPPFRRQVLNACRKIPQGKTATYTDLARAVGNPNAARAVGGAMANNPIPLIIPCHRVLRSDGSLGGFSSPQGTKLKRRMLELEGASLPG